NGRRHTGAEFDAIMGVNFLVNQIVQIDFDAGKFRLLSALPPNPGERIGFEYTADGLPAVAACIGSLDPEWFYVDTGSNVPTGVQRSLFMKLRDAGDLSRIEPVTVANTREILGRVPSLALGSFSHRDVQIHSTGYQMGVLGLDYLSRYNIIID